MNLPSRHLLLALALIPLLCPVAAASHVATGDTGARVETADERQSDPGPATDPATAVRAYLALWNGEAAGDPEGRVSNDFRRHARPGESPASPGELADLIRRTRDNFGQVRIEVRELFCDGDRCALSGVFTGRVPGTNRGVSIPLVAFYRVADGRVAEEWVVSNQLPTMFGLGYQVAAPGFTVRPATPDGAEGGP